MLSILWNVIKTLDISYNVIKKCFGSLCEPLKYFFNLSIENGVFRIYNGEDSSDISNYKSISVLPCFYKILQRIMYNCLYKYLIKNNILYSKQFGFQNGHSNDHAVVHLVGQITESFENNKIYTWCIHWPIDGFWQCRQLHSSQKNWNYMV